MEACKGILVLAVGLGIHTMAGHDLRHAAESLVRHLHLNPASEVPNSIIVAASSLTDSRLTLLALGALIYSMVRFIEAFGLWRGMLWTKWFALVSGAIYLPFEMYEVIKHSNSLSISVLLVNLLIVGYMVYVLLNPQASENSVD